MDNKTKAILLAAGAALLIALVVLTSNDSDPWILSFDPEDKSACGSYVLAQMLQDEVDSIGFFTIEDSLQSTLDLTSIPENSNYVFVGKAFFADSSEIDHLLQFVKEGGQAYIISNRVPNQLLELFLDPKEYTLNGEAYDDFEDDYEFEHSYDYIQRYGVNEIEAYIDSDTLDADPVKAEFKYVTSNKFRHYTWAYFDAILAEDQLEGIRTGYFAEGHLNFFEATMGKGMFTFHSNPEVFSNYYLLERKNQIYQQAIFQNLGEGNIYWDVVNHKFQSLGSDMPNHTTPGALVFILSQPALKYGWYLLLLGALIYLLLGARRAQSALRVINPNENTSIEYSTAIAELYLQKNDHRKIGLLEIDLFKTFLRERYGMTISRDDEQNEKLTKLLALKSNIELEHVNLLFTTFKNCRIEYKVSDENLAQLHHDLNHFYTNCK